MPSGRVLELTQMGGVDSVSNPLAQNPQRSLRCQNWCPQKGGFLKQRYGFSTATYFGTYTLFDSGCHSAFYFDIDTEATGSTPTVQGAVIAIGGHIDVITLGASPAATQITNTADGDPFQVFVSDNKLYIPCGDPSAGFPDSTDGLPTVADDGGGPNTWTGTSNIYASTASYASVDLFQGVPYQNYLNTSGFPLAVPADAAITGVQITCEAYSTGTVGIIPYLRFNLTQGGAVIGTTTPNQQIFSTSAGAPTAISYGGIGTMMGASLTPSLINAGQIGVQVQAYASLPSLGNYRNFYANDLTLTIFFSRQGSDDTWFTDGVTARRSGIRAPSNLEVASVTVSESNTVTGTFGSTSYSGYQFYLSYYNPATGHVGNRVSIGDRLQVAGTESSVVISGLPNLSTVNPEWVKLIGRTADNGEVPYVCDLPLLGTWVVVGNSSTIGTLTSSSIDFESELPIMNGTPPLMHKCATALGRVYAIDDSDPTKIIYSASADDLTGSSNFVGVPAQSWDPTSQIVSRTGETFRGIQSVNDEIWGFTRNYLSIITELGLYSPDGNPSPYIRGTWPGGCCGQRAFCQTPYGPFWLNSQKQLMTRGESGPTVVSGEYESALLSNFISAQLDTVEMIYYRDPSRFIDRIYITGQATLTGESTYFATIVHDFAIGGQGYEYQYAGSFPCLYMRDPTHTFSFRDSNQDYRLVFVHSLSSHEFIYRMEDGSLDDNSATITSDMIGVVNVGIEEPTFRGLDISGDSNLKVTHWTDLTLSLASITALTADVTTATDSRCARFHVDFEEGSQFLGIRMQLSSHPSDAPSKGLDDSSLTHIPLESYGRVLVVRSELGVGRRVGGGSP